MNARTNVLPSAASWHSAVIQRAASSRYYRLEITKIDVKIEIYFVPVVDL